MLPSVFLVGLLCLLSALSALSLFSLSAPLFLAYLASTRAEYKDINDRRKALRIMGKASETMGRFDDMVLVARELIRLVVLVCVCVCVCVGEGRVGGEEEITDLSGGTCTYVFVRVIQ
jgi:hypothetical protein